MKKFFAPILILLALQCTPAHSHSALVTSSPNADSTIMEMPRSITLEFNEELLVIGENSGNQLALVDPSGEQVLLEDIGVDRENLSAVIADSEFADGVYSVIFRAVSADGHVIKSEYKFTLQSDPARTVVSSSPDLEPSKINLWLGVVSGAFLLLAIITTWWRLKNSKEG